MIHAHRNAGPRRRGNARAPVRQPVKQHTHRGAVGQVHGCGSEPVFQNAEGKDMHLHRFENIASWELDAAERTFERSGLERGGSIPYASDSVSDRDTYPRPKGANGSMHHPFLLATVTRGDTIME